MVKRSYNSFENPREIDKEYLNQIKRRIGLNRIREYRGRARDLLKTQDELLELTKKDLLNHYIGVEDLLVELGMERLRGNRYFFGYSVEINKIMGRFITNSEKKFKKIETRLESRLDERINKNPIIPKLEKLREICVQHGFSGLDLKRKQNPSKKVRVNK